LQKKQRSSTLLWKILLFLSHSTLIHHKLSQRDSPRQTEISTSADWQAQRELRRLTRKTGCWIPRR